MTTACNHPLRVLVILAFVAAVLSGCAPGSRNLAGATDTQRSGADAAALQKAIAVYEAGEFADALVRFEALAAAGTDNTVGRQARLGEICSRLMLAETQAEYIAAVDMWREFNRRVPNPESAWELSLLDPLIVRMTPKVTTQVVEIKPAPTQDKTGTPADPPASSQQVQKLRNELSAMKQKAAKLPELQQRLNESEAENRILKEKIKALEAIDQNIQKKKTEISTPSE